MSFIGLGSVSDYILHNAACPVMIIRPPSADQQQQAAAALLPPPPPRPLRCVCVAVDDSASAKLALNWAVDHLIRHKLMTRGSSLQQQQQQHEQEQGGGSSSSSDWRLHIVTVAQAVPVPVRADVERAVPLHFPDEFEGLF